MSGIVNLRGELLKTDVVGLQIAVQAGLTRPFKGQAGRHACCADCIRPLKGLIRPLKGLIRPFKAL